MRRQEGAPVPSYSYYYSEHARSPRLNASLKTSAAWVWLPAVAMASTLGVILPTPADATATKTLPTTNHTVKLYSYTGYSAFYIASGSTITRANPYISAIYGDASHIWTITNKGVIALSGGYSNQAGIKIKGSTSFATVINSGSIGGVASQSHGIIFYGGGYVSNSSSGVIKGSSQPAIESYSGALTVQNAGYIGNASTGNAIVSYHGGYVGNTGTIKGGIKIANVDGSTIHNTGYIGNRNQNGIYFNSSNNFVYSSGTLAGGNEILEFKGSNDTLKLAPSAVFASNAAAAVYTDGSNNLVEFAAGGSAGTIAFSDFRSSGGYGWNFQVDAGASWEFTNSGTGTIAGPGHSFTVASTGTAVFDGTVLLDGNFVNNNAGQGIQLGTGDDTLILNGDNANLSGLKADGGTGHNTLAFYRYPAGTWTNGLSGDTSFTNFDTFKVLNGSNWYFGGSNTIASGDELINQGKFHNVGTLIDAGYVTNSGTFFGNLTVSNGGTLTNSGRVTGTVYSSGSTNTITNSGSITGITLGGGNDLLQWKTGATASGTIDGGAGTDTFELVTGNGGTLSNNLSNFETLQIDSGAAWVLAGTSSFGTITDNGTLTNAGTLTSTASFTANGTLVNAGAIIGNSGTAVAFGTGADLLQIKTGASFTGIVDGGAGTDVLEFTSGSSGTLSNNFANFETAELDSTANWTLSGHSSFGTITVGSGETLKNTGTLTAVSTLSNAGVIINTGSLIASNYATNSGSISGTLVLNGSGTVTNQSGATITGGSIWGIDGSSGTQTVTNAGYVSGGFVAIELASGGAIVNSGTLIGTASVSYGALLYTGGHFTNSSGGLVSGNYAGLIIHSVGASISNAGTIIQTGNHPTYAGIWFKNGGNSTLTNSGTITGDGGTAVRFSTGNDLLQINTGAVFTGTVDGGSGTDIVELVTGNGGTLSNLFSNFETLKADSPSSWVLNNNDTFATVTIANGATLSNAGTLAASSVFTDAGALINNGNISSTVTITGSGTLSNTGQIAGGADGVDGDNGGAHTLTNSGQIISAPSHIGVYLADGGLVTNSGTASEISADTAGVKIAGASGAVANSGTIVSASGSGVLLAAGGTVTNSGTASYIGGALKGIYVQTSPGTVTNQGTIKATSGSGVLMKAGGTLNNSGTASYIAVVGADGVRIDGAAGSITNQGTIKVQGGIHGIYLSDGGTINNSGSAALISGLTGVAITGAAGTLTNSGTITGSGGTAVAMGGGNDLVQVNTGAVFNGTVDGGAGTDIVELVTGAGGTLSNLFSNFETLKADSPSSWVLNNNDTFATVTIANGATLSNAGTLTATSNFYNDGKLSNSGRIVGAVTLTANGTLSNSGTISGGANGVYGDNSGAHTLTNTGSIIGSAFGVQFAAGGYVNNSGTASYIHGATSGSPQAGVYISGAAGTVINAGSISGYYGVRLHNGGQVGNSGTITGTFGVYLNNGGTVTNSTTSSYIKGGGSGIESEASAVVANSGTIMGVNYGVYLRHGGNITNSGTASYIHGDNAGVLIASGVATVTNAGIISGGSGVAATSSAATVINSGTITSTGNAIDLDQGGYVGNSGTASIIQGGTSGDVGVRISGAAGTVVNAGSIAGNYGVYLALGGVVTNGGSLNTGASITAAYGVAMNASGTVTNYGTIKGSNIGVLLVGGVFINSGTASYLSGDGSEALDLLQAAGSVTNQGTIISASGSAIRFDSAGSGASLNNSGLIKGASYGVSSASAAATLTNTGTIQSTTGAGIKFFDNSGTYNNTVINAGKIIGAGGEDAIAFGAGNDVLQIKTGASFTGTIDGEAGTDTLELVTGAGGTLSNNFANFETLKADSPSSWVLNINNSFATVTIANGATLSNAGTLTAGSAFNDAGVLINSGYISGTVTLASTAALTNQSGATIQGSSIGLKDYNNFTLTNAGTIAATSGTGTGVSLAGSGTFTNHGVILGGLSGLSNSLSAANFTVINYGSINSTNASGYTVQGALNSSEVLNNKSTGAITATRDAARVNGTVINAGVIAGGTASNAVGVILYQNGIVTNASTGTISGGAGISAFGGAATITNYGTIKGVAGAGVTLGNFTNVVDNHGLISGTSNAITFGTGNDTLNIYTGASFTGTVDAAAGTDTLNFKTGTGATLSNNFINFENATLANGASWVLAGNNSLGAIYDLGTLNNKGSISGHVNLASTGAAGAFANTGTVTGGSSAGVYSNVSATLTNAGVVSGYRGIALYGGGAVSNSGTASSLTGSHDGIYVRGSSGTVTNAGTIIGTSNAGIYLNTGGTILNGGTTNSTALIRGGAFGIYAAGAATITNYGGIAATASSGRAVYLDSGGLVVNKAGGTITDASGVGVKFSAAGSLNNAGLITSTGSGGAGVRFAAGAGTITNTGTIRGTSAGGGAYGVDLGGGGTVSNSGTGSNISGYMGVVVASAAGSLTNQGTITGVNYGVYLRHGGSITNSGTASFITGGASGISVSGAAGVIINYGTISGTAGPGVVFAGGFNNTLVNMGAIIGNGGTAVQFGSGDDLLEVGSGASFTGIADGGAGTDTLEFLSSTSGTVSGFVNFENISLGTLANWTFTGNTTIASGATLANQGTFVGSGNLVDAGVLSNTGTIQQTVTLSGTGTLYNGGLIRAGTAVLGLSGAAGTLTNSGTINGTSGNGVQLVSGGHVLNSGTGSYIGGTHTAVQISGGPEAVVNYGTIKNTGTSGYGIYFDGSGTVTNKSSGHITGASYGIEMGGAGMVDNSGTIKGSGTSSNGIYMEVGGYVLNRSGAYISGANRGVWLGGGGTLSNAGTVIGADGVSIRDGAGTVINAGTIKGLTGNGVVMTYGGTFNNNSSGAYLYGKTAGIYLTHSVISPAAANLSNLGTIASAGKGVQIALGGGVGNSGLIRGTTGVLINGGAGSVNNSGTIQGTAGPGIDFTGGSGTYNNTVTNSGAIIGSSGQDSIRFGAGNDILRLAPGASFTGTPDGGAGSNTLEFTGGLGTITGLGASFANFGSITVDSGAGWVFTYANTVASGVSLTNAGEMINRGTFTNAGAIAITGNIYNGGLLINSGSITGTVGLVGTGSLNNSGHITGGVAVNGYVATVSITNSGTIKGTTTNGITLVGGAVSNSGTASYIYGKNIGISVSAAAATVTNYGRIIGSTNTGVALTAGGTVRNVGTASYIQGGSKGVSISGAAGTVVNYGTIKDSVSNGITISGGGAITNSGAGALIQGGVGIGAGGNGVTVITNSGTIKATGGDAISFSGTGNNTLINGGTIIGNAGTAVAFGSGNDLLEIETGSVFTGVVDGGTGINTVEFVSGAHSPGTYSNFQILLVDSGAGGGLATATNLVSTVTNSGSFTNGANLTFSNGVLTNAAGAYLDNTGTLNIVNSNFSNAGTFANSALVQNSNTSFSLAAVTLTGAGMVSNSGTIIGIYSAIYGAPGSTPGVTNTGTIKGLSGYGVYFSQGGSITNGDTAHTGALIYGTTQGVAIKGGAGTVTNFATITGNSSFYQGVYLGAGGQVANKDAASLIQGAGAGVRIAGGAGTVGNDGTITGAGTHGVWLSSGGAVTNGGTANSSARIAGAQTGIYVQAAAGTVVNYGSIAGTAHYGVYLKAGGSVTNSGTAARISGYEGGVLSHGAADTISNAGTIIGTGTTSAGTVLIAGAVSNSGLISGGAYGISSDGTLTTSIFNSGTVTGGLANIIVAAGPGTVSNLGVIGGVSFVGVDLIKGGSVINGDTAHTGASITASYAVAFGTGAGTLTNFGTISGSTAGVVLYAGGSVTNAGTASLISGVGAIGVKGGAGAIVNAGTLRGSGAEGVTFLDTGGTFNNTLTNSGTIIGASGHDAVLFGAGNDRLILQAGYKFTGLVDGGAGTNTLEVGSGSLTFTNVGTEFLEFSVLDVDSGASLNLTGVTTIASGQTIDNSGSVGNAGTTTLTISGVFDNSGTFSNAGTLSVPGTFVNIGSFGNTGLVTGATNGITGGGTITNSGTIIGTGNDGVDMTGPGTLTNTGLIQGGKYGLQAGAGDTIINTGTIKDPGVAGASLGSGANLTNQTGELITGTTGVIFTGTGASLTNAGTITGTGGVAIQFAAGSNALALGAGSVESGTIDGGGGAGQIALSGTNTITNTITNFGTASALTLASGADWTATGSWTIAGVTNGGTLQAGTLTSPLKLTGKFTQSSAGTLRVALDAGGTNSQLQVTGAASLAGAVAVVPSGTFTAASTKFTIITATAGVSGTFSSITGGTALLTPVLSYDANDAFVSIVQQNVATTTGGGSSGSGTSGSSGTSGGSGTSGSSGTQPAISSFTETSNELAVAKAYDAGRAANATAFAPSLTALDTLQATGVTSSLDRLAGENNADISTAALIQGRQFLGLLQDHSLQTRGADPVWGAWGTGFAQNGSLAGDGSTHRLSETVNGAAGGLDYWFTPTLRVGLAAGLGNGDMIVGGGNGSARLTYADMALTGDFTQNDFYLSGVLAGAFDAAQTIRDVSLPGLSARANGHTDNSAILGSLEGGYTAYRDQTMSLTPFAAFNLGSVAQDAFTETGAGTLNLTVAEKTSSSAQSILGARVNLGLPLGGLNLSTDFKLAWAHEFTTARLANESFAGIAGTNFSVMGAALPGDTALFGVGLGAQVTTDVNAYIRYEGQVGSGSNSQSFTAGIRISW